MPFPRLAAMLFASLAGSLAMAQVHPHEAALRDIATHHGLLVNQIGDIPLDWLPKEPPFPAGKLSLRIDPEDRSDGNIAFILANNTPEERLVYPLPFQEIKVGKHWIRSQPYVPFCGSGGAEGRIRAGRALVWPVPDPGRGDMDAEIRYCLSGYQQEPLTSAPMKGKVRAADVDAAGCDAVARIGLLDELNRCASTVWTAGRFTADAGEFAAAMELERAYDESRQARTKLRRWLDRKPGIPAEDAALLHAVLQRPWERVLDERNCLETCIRALSASPAEREAAAPGNPLRYPAVVWGYLVSEPETRFETFINPERHAALEALKASGNPWGATPEECRTLAALAERSIRSGDEREARQARAFLNMTAEGKR